MHTLRRMDDGSIEVGYYQPYSRGNPDASMVTLYEWVALEQFLATDINQAYRFLSFLNGGECHLP